MLQNKESWNRHQRHESFLASNDLSKHLVRRLSWVSLHMILPWVESCRRTATANSQRCLCMEKQVHLYTRSAFCIWKYPKHPLIPVFKAQLKDLKWQTYHLPSGSSLRCAPRYVPWHLPGHSGPSLQIVINYYWKALLPDSTANDLGSKFKRVLLTVCCGQNINNPRQGWTQPSWCLGFRW